MSKTKELIGKISIMAIQYYFLIAIMIFAPYLNWKYANENGFMKWFFLGEATATWQAVIWPYYLYERYYIANDTTIEIIGTAKAKEYIKQGMGYALLGKHQQALAAFKEAVRVEPDNVLAHCLMGTAHSHLGNYNDAIAAYKEAIRLKPDYSTAYFDLGTTFQELHRHQEAVEAYRQAIHLKPDDPYSHYTLGAAYLALGNQRGALEECRVLQSLDRGIAEDLLKLIKAHK
jgi:tetratricopeptide (TPR) repeat protein